MKASKTITIGLFLIIALLTSGLAPLATAQSSGTSQLLATLSKDKKSAATAMTTLVAKGEAAVTPLVKHAMNRDNLLESRGRALICLARIGDESAIPLAKSLCTDNEEDQLIRIWAIGLMTKLQGAGSLETMLELIASGQASSLRETLNKRIVNMGPAAAQDLTHILFTHNNDQVRRMATSFLGAQQIDSEETREAYMNAFRFTEEKAENGAIWKGGALYIPGIQRNQQQARDLIAEIIHWWLWAENGPNGQVRGTELNNLKNNLRSVGLIQQAGMNRQNIWQADGSGLALTWAETFGFQKNGSPTDDATQLQEAGRLLVHALEQGRSSQDKVVKTLERLSGKDYGFDINKWYRWIATMR